MKRFWSIMLTLVLVLSLMPTGALTLTANAVVEESGEYYTGTLAATVSGTHTKSGTTIVSEATVMSAADAFVPGISADWVKFTWPDVDAFNTVLGAHCATPVTGLTPTTGDAVLFYVKLPANTPATQMGVRIQNMSGNRDLLADGKVYLLPSNGDAWLEKTATIAAEKVAGGTMKGVGYFDVPENFEGWVRVPIASTALEENITLKTLRVFLLNVGETYAADYVGIGAISVIDNADKDYIHLTTDGGYSLVKLTGSNEDGEEGNESGGLGEYYTGTLAATVAGTHTKKDTTIVCEATVMPMQVAFVPGVSADWVKFTWHDVAGFNSIVGAQCATPITGLMPIEDGAVLFYVKLPANTPATQMGVRIQNISGNRDLLADAKVHLLPADGGAWLEKTATIATEKVAGGTMKGVGYFDVPENFEGWVRVPLANTALEANIALKTLRIFLLNIDETYAADYLGVGAISVIDNAYNDYKYLTVDGGNSFVKLTTGNWTHTHVYDGTCDTTCNDCGAKRQVAHKYDNACDADCNLCGVEREVTHEYDNACDVSCNVCGAEREVAEHIYSNSCDADCDACGFIRPVTHVFTDACDGECDLCFKHRTPPHKYRAECDMECDLCGKMRDWLHLAGNYQATFASLTAADVMKNSAGELILTGALVDDDYANIASFVPGDWANWTITNTSMVNEYNASTTGPHFVLRTSGITLREGGALMMYIKLPGNTGTTKIGFRPVDTQNRELIPNAPIYFLSNDSYAWEERAIIPYPVAAGGMGKDVGYIEVPADFEGWVRIPQESTEVEAGSEITRIRTFVETVNDNFVTQGISIGGVCVVEEAYEHFLMLSSADGAIEIPLTNKKWTPVHVRDNACDAFCNECGAEREVNHKYDSDYDRLCNVCGAVRVVLPDAIAIEALPSKAEYLLGEEFDATGLTIKLIYGDGSAETITDGFEVSGFDSSAEGAKTLTVNYCGKTTNFSVMVRNPVPDENAPAFIATASQGNVRAGDTFTVAVSIKNNPGIVSFKVDVGYDADVLELVSIQEQDFSGTAFGPLTANPIAVNWFDTLNPNNTTNGTAAVLTFKVKEDAALGNTRITLEHDPENMYDFNFENVAFAMVDTQVSVIEYIPGDVNGDGVANNKDLGLLQRHINGWDVTINAAAGDVSADGAINNKDLGLLQRSINGWDVELK